MEPDYVNSGLERRMNIDYANVHDGAESPQRMA